MISFHRTISTPMKPYYRVLPIIVLLMAASVGLTHAQTSDTVKSAKGRFTVVFPTWFPLPTISSTKVPTDVGTLKMITFMSTSTDAACMVAYADYPQSAFKGTDLEEMLDSTRAGTMGNINGHVLREESITLNGYPGRTVYFSGSTDDMQLYGRFDYYIVKPRLYQVGYMSANEDDITQPNTDAFFESFALINRTNKRK